MPRSAINDSGSNYQFADKLEKPRVPRSLFDLSFKNTMTIPREGMIIPVALFETLPADDWQLDVSCLLRVMPQQVPLYSRQRIFIHAYYSRYLELWNEAETFITKGYTGNENLIRPSISANNMDSTVFSGKVEPESLADYFGLPIGATYANLSKAGVSALPFMMYERVYRDYYMNKNYYTTSRQWLPNDDGDLRLDTSGYVISSKGQTTNEIPFGKIHYRDWTQDYFTSALPWPQRGDAPYVGLDADSSLRGTQTVYIPNSNVPVGLGYTLDSFGNNSFPFPSPGSNVTPYNYVTYWSEHTGNYAVGNLSHAISPSFSSGTGFPVDGRFVIPNEESSAILSHVISPRSYLGVTLPSHTYDIDFSNATLQTLGARLFAEDFRTLFVNQSILEKTARTDGSYTEFGYAFFGESSKASRDFRPRYIGGTYQPIVFTEVIQNSETTDQSPLGAQAGHGISTTSNTNIGRVHCDDYGYIMILASIMPDTYYSQGLDKMWTRSTQSDMYLPERAKLGMQAILNQELYFSGNQAQDIDVWAYQSRYDELRYSPNKVHGKIADPKSTSFYPYTQSRQFNSLPGFSQDFARADDVRAEMYFAPTESHYSAIFAVGAKVVRPLPYKAIPATII